MAPIDRYLPAWTGALWEQVAGPAQEFQQQARGVSDLRLLLEALQAEMADLADLAMAWLTEEQDPLSGLPAERHAAQSVRAVPVSGVPGAPGQPRSDAAALLRRQPVALESEASTMPDQPAVDLARHRFLRQLAGAAPGSAPELTATSPVSAGARQHSAQAAPRPQAAATAWGPAQSGVAPPIPSGSEPEFCRGCGCFKVACQEQRHAVCFGRT